MRIPRTAGRRVQPDSELEPAGVRMGAGLRPAVAPVLVVFARRAGRADFEPLEAACVAAFGSGALRWLELDGADLESRLDDALDALRGEGGERVIAAGGDGTVSLVAGRIAASRARHALRLGIVPLGTANVLARELGIPLDPGEAVRLAAESEHERVIDGIRAGAAACSRRWAWDSMRA